MTGPHLRIGIRDFNFNPHYFINSSAFRLFSTNSQFRTLPSRPRGIGSAQQTPTKKGKMSAGRLQRRQCEVTLYTLRSRPKYFCHIGTPKPSKGIQDVLHIYESLVYDLLKARVRAALVPAARACAPAAGSSLYVANAPWEVAFGQTVWSVNWISVLVMLGVEPFAWIICTSQTW